MADTNIIIIIVAFVVAIGAIYILYSIILFQGGSGKKGDELQLSTKNILEAANEVIQHNSMRKEKALWTELPKGEPIRYGRYDNEYQEAQGSCKGLF